MTTQKKNITKQYFPENSMNPLTENEAAHNILETKGNYGLLKIGFLCMSYTIVG